MQFDTLTSRRLFCGFISGGLLVVAGCDNSVIKTAPTPTLEQTRHVLKGLEIVAFKVGEKLIQLPEPGLRVVGIVLYITATGCEVIISYIDVELKQREIKEQIDEQTKMYLEEKRFVDAVLENGNVEKVYFGEIKYE